MNKKSCTSHKNEKLKVDKNCEEERNNKKTMPKTFKSKAKSKMRF